VKIDGNRVSPLFGVTRPFAAFLAGMTRAGEEEGEFKAEITPEDDVLEGSESGSPVI